MPDCSTELRNTPKRVGIRRTVSDQLTASEQMKKIGGDALKYSDQACG